MRPPRVIRPTRVLPDVFPVLIPEGCRESGTDTATAATELDRVETEQELELRAALSDLEHRWGEREQEHTEELRRVEVKEQEKAREEIRTAVSRFTTIVEDFLAQREELLKSSEETVLRLALAVARRVTLEAIEVNEEVVLGTVRSALRHIIDKENVTIRVNPEDLKIVREHSSEWLGIAEGTRSLEIEEDERIRRGGCLVETEAGNVEAQIDKQIQTLEKALIESVR
jgi:flagellar assembly protein FliH